jgi:hypothetical protein
MRGITSIASISGRELGRAASEVRNIVIQACKSLGQDFAVPVHIAAADHALRVMPSTLFPSLRAAGKQ